MASIFDFVAWHWPVTSTSTSSVRTQSNQSLEDGYELGSSTPLDGTLGQHLEMWGDEEGEDHDPEPIMALPVDPPRDSQVLDDTFVANSPVPPLDDEIVDDKEPQPSQVPEVADLPDPVPVASPVGSSSVAPTEIEVTPSPAPKHTAEHPKEDKEVIEVVESPIAPKEVELNLDEVQAKIEALKRLSLSSFEFFPSC